MKKKKNNGPLPKPENSPHRAQDKQIGAKVQLTEPLDKTNRNPAYLDNHLEFPNQKELTDMFFDVPRRGIAR